MTESVSSEATGDPAPTGPAATEPAPAEPATAFGTTTLDVPAATWLDHATRLRDEQGMAFFDWLSAYDDGDGGLAVVLSLWSQSQRRRLLLRTRVSREGGRLPTLTGVWPGANWHERETFEMFGIGFDGHPNLVPLLLPDGFAGHPLRKEFVLASRVAKSWPGAKEPGESDSVPLRAERDEKPSRRRMLPPGVPDPDAWGPESARPDDGGAP